MIELLILLIGAYEFVLLARIILSWIHLDNSNPIVNIIYQITDPVLEPVRKLLPLSGMGIDFSPIAVFLALGLLKGVLKSMLY